jgi:uncharacterized protein (TIGR00290 family)
VTQVALSWSGGKDSALALRALRDEPGIEPSALITTFTEEYDRVSMHGVRRELIEAQAKAIGIPLVEVQIPAGCSNDVYEARFAAGLDSAPLKEATSVAFADLFLDDIRRYREAWFERLGRETRFPIWNRDTGMLAREFIEAGFEAVLVCVDPGQLDPSFAGRAFDEALLADLPTTVDPCGENGEFHTFVHAGPIFDQPIPIEVGEISVRDGFAFCEIADSRRDRPSADYRLKVFRKSRADVVDLPLGDVAAQD